MFSCALMMIISIQVNIGYKSGAKVLKIITPVRKRGIKRLARRSYRGLSSTVLGSSEITKSVVAQLCRKITAEMKQLSSDEYNSVLRDNMEAFNWETVMFEFEKKLPTLVNLLNGIIPRPAQQRPLLGLLISQLLKSRHQRMGLVQRAISLMLYGNGAGKQVRPCIVYTFLS